MIDIKELDNNEFLVKKEFLYNFGVYWIFRWYDYPEGLIVEYYTDGTFGLKTIEWMGKYYKEIDNTYENEYNLEDVLLSLENWKKYCFIQNLKEKGNEK